MATESESISIRLSRAMVGRLKMEAGQGALDSHVEHVLAVFQVLRERGFASVQAKVTVAEARAILDVQNGAYWSGGDLYAWFQGTLARQIENGILYDKLDRKWSIDGPVLVSKLEGMTDTETLALLAWSRTFWLSPEKDIDKAMESAVQGFMES